MRAILADGCGGAFIGLSFCDLYHTYINKNPIEFHLISSPVVYSIIDKLAPKFIKVIHHKDSTNDLELCDRLKKTDPHTFCLTPDRFGVGPFHFNNLGITWKQCKQNRFLQKQFPTPRTGKKVFLGLITAQEGNEYPFSIELIANLCRQNPDYSFYFANVKKWSDKKVGLELDEEFIKEHKNLFVYDPISAAVDYYYICKEMDYIISVDNGIGNLAYFLNRERFLIDSRFNNLAFKMRWRSDSEDLIPIDCDPVDIAGAFKLVVDHPELSGIPKVYLAKYPKDVLMQNLIYKN